MNYFSNKRLGILCASFFLSVVGLYAQGLVTGILNESYLYRHQVNPAYANQKNYIAFPIVSNTSIGLYSNTPLGNFIYTNAYGKETSFMDESVDRGAFLNGLDDINKASLNLDMTLISAGFKAGKGYGTFELNLRSQMGIMAPKDLFAFIKDNGEISNKRYDISNTALNAKAYAELALGYSHPIGEHLKIGGKVKLLGGLAYANAKIEKLTAECGSLDIDNVIGETIKDGVQNLNPNDCRWALSLDGHLEMAAGGEFDLDNEGFVKGYDTESPQLNGLGFALDLGAVYDMSVLVPGLSVSAAVIDLGFINWRDVATAGAHDREFYFDGFESFTPETAGSLSSQLDDITKDLQDVYKFAPSQTTTTIRERLDATVNVGVDYRLPIYDKLAIGYLYLKHFSDYNEYAENRLTLSWSPCKIIDFAISGSSSDYGSTLGALVNLHLLGLNIFAGSDRLYMGDVNENNIPLEKIGNDFRFGVNIEFGANKKKKE